MFIIFSPQGFWPHGPQHFLPVTLLYWTNDIFSSKMYCIHSVSNEIKDPIDEFVFVLDKISNIMVISGNLCKNFI